MCAFISTSTVTLSACARRLHTAAVRLMAASGSAILCIVAQKRCCLQYRTTKHLKFPFLYITISHLVRDSSQLRVADTASACAGREKLRLFRKILTMFHRKM